GPTSLREALQVAAGLANPSKQIGEGIVASKVVTPKLLIYTDGGFADVEGFSLGNLEPEVIVIGPPSPPLPPRPTSRDAKGDPPKGNPPPDTPAILALRPARNEERTDQFQIFGGVRNYRNEPVQTQ